MAVDSENTAQVLSSGLDEAAPGYLDSAAQVGNKTWRLVPGDGIKISKTTSSSIDTYTFEAEIAEDDDNVIEAKEDGLYVPEVTSRTQAMEEEIEDLRVKIENLRLMEFRSSESVMMKKDTDLSTGDEYVVADVIMSLQDGNNLELKSDGLYSKATDYGTGSITDITARLRVLEQMLLTINQEIDYLKTTAIVDADGNVTPPTVAPDHSIFEESSGD